MNGEKATVRKQGDVEKGEIKPVGKWRRALPQVLASTAKNLLLLDLGMTLAFPTIVIPVLASGKDPGGLSLTEENISWFASIVFICQPLGSVLSGLVLEPLGRKYSMMAVNVPHIVGWFVFYSATSKIHLYVAAMIMGLGVGFMEAPIITYVGEISEPKLRGTLTSYSNLFATFGMVLIYALGTTFDWRTTAAISMSLPIITILALTQVPETPLWLLARGREDEAEKALCWLRGWTKPANIRAELAELKTYALTAHKIKIVNKEAAAYDNPTFELVEGSKQEQIKETVEEQSSHTFLTGLKDVGRPAVLKPLLLIVGYFFFSHFTGLTSTRPYMHDVIKFFKFPVEPYRATVLFGAIAFTGSILCMTTIAKFHKRPIALLSMVICSLCGIGLGFLPKGYPTLVVFGLLVFFSSYGAAGLVWTLVSEVFPMRGRGQASGIAGASSYILAFVSTKSYLSLNLWLGTSGLFIAYGCISFVGFVFLYWLMPETEGITLQEIEQCYKKKLGKQNS